MPVLVSERQDEPWRRRLYLPAYPVGEAARYARVSPRTVAAWHREDARAKLTLTAKGHGEELSYLQLIEVAVVAAFRKGGISLRRIRDARAYISKALHTEFPFAAYTFKTDGKNLLMDYQQVEGGRGKGKLLEANIHGQLAWDDIIGARLQEFDYDGKGIAVKWRLAGPGSPVFIDPQVAFGTPTVSGTPTWVIKERWGAGESIEDISYDFRLTDADVSRALEFEGITPDVTRRRKWVH